MNLTKTGLTDVCLEKLILRLKNLEYLRIAENSQISGSAFTKLEEKSRTRPNLRKDYNYKFPTQLFALLLIHVMIF